MAKRRRTTQPPPRPKPVPRRPWRIRLPWRPRFIPGHWLIVAVIAVPALAGLLPLTYDEAWNYLNLSAHGVRSVLRSYPVPNNHVLFTALQALLPNPLPDWWPPLLRLPNLLYFGALLSVTAAILERAGHARQRAVWLAAAVVFAAPIPALYTIVARGYLLGLLFVALSLLAAMEERLFRAAVLMALAAWCVPTFAYWWPPFALLPLAGQGVGRLRAWTSAALASALFGGLVGAAYYPLRAELKRFAQYRFWDLPETAGGLFQGVAQHTLFVHALLPQAVAAVLFVLAWGLLLAGWRTESQDGPRRRLLFLALAGVVSGLAVPAAAWAAGTSRLPFIRNMIVIPFLVSLGLALLPDRLRRFPRGRGRDAASVFLAANALLGAGWLASACLGGDPNRLPGFRPLNGTPIERAVFHGVALQRAELRTTFLYEPVVQAYLRRYQYSYELAPRAAPAPCLSGSRPPQASMIQIRHGGRWLELCF